MSLSTNKPVPGLMQPTQKAMLSGNPRDSAIASQNASNQKLNNLNQISKGGRRRSRGGAIAVPQYQMNYTPQNGPGQDPNSVIKQNSQISTQGTENAKYDSLATQSGGKSWSKSKKGGKYNPDWSWGCYSGGRKSRRRSHRRSRRTRTNKRRGSRRH